MLSERGRGEYQSVIQIRDKKQKEGVYMKEEGQQHRGKEMEVSNVGRNVKIQLHK